MKKLTLKQKKFIENYLRNGGNATGAAMEVYTPKNRHVAESMGWENMRKPEIQEIIRQELERGGISLEDVLKNIKANMEAGMGVKARASDSLKASEILLKVMGAFPDQRRTSTTMSTEIRYEGMTRSELIAERKKLRMFWSGILDS